MAVRKSFKESDYQLPGNAEWSDNSCPGSVGSVPNLVDIERQNTENTNAQRENRKPVAIAIHCSFCNGYHLDMQPDPKTLIENNRHANYLPPMQDEPEVDQELVDKAALAVVDNANLVEEEADDSGDKSVESDSSKGNSDSSAG